MDHNYHVLFGYIRLSIACILKGNLSWFLTEEVVSVDVCSDGGQMHHTSMIEAHVSICSVCAIVLKSLVKPHLVSFGELMSL